MLSLSYELLAAVGMVIYLAIFMFLLMLVLYGINVWLE